jgi:Ca2+-binding EF-hand superfamily protein
VVKRLDTNKDGSINFQELCQIMRVVVDNNDVKKRMREFNLVKQSKLPFDEAEDWNALFLACDEEGRGELQLAQMRTLLENIGLKWDHEMSETVKSWMQEADENASDTIDFGEFCIFVSKLWTTDYHNIRAACRQFLKKDTAVSLKSVHGTYLGTDTSGDMFARSTTIGQAETFMMSIHTNTNASFRGFHGKSVDVHEEKVTCLEERSGTQFKMTPQDDDRVIFVAATSFGGVLYATPDGMVRCSDGNPNDIPNAIFELIRQEDLQKKCWSRSVMKRRPSKLVAPTKKPSLEPDSPTSPGLKQSIAEMDEALEANKK